MIYLKDTCIFIHRLDANNIIQIMQKYQGDKDFFGVTNIILDELKPGKSIPIEDADKSKSMVKLISLIQKSKTFIQYDIEKDEKISDNFSKIRKRFYGHLTDLNAVKKALANEEISKESFDNKSYKFKDYGECSCIAVAMEQPEKISIVSDDKGRVFLKPDINLFKKYQESHNIVVLNHREWKEIYNESYTPT